MNLTEQQKMLLIALSRGGSIVVTIYGVTLIDNAEQYIISTVDFEVLQQAKLIKVIEHSFRTEFWGLSDFGEQYVKC